jgi:hypothetical protein
MGTHGIATSFIGVDNNNQVYNDYCVITGGQDNRAGGTGDVPTDYTHATVGGGDGNSASGVDATVGGGYHNGAGNYGTVGGGKCNSAFFDCDTIGGGNGNDALGPHATVGGGDTNAAMRDYATIGGGKENEAWGNMATVPGGEKNYANGDYSFAAGRRAKIDATHPGAFLFADSTDADFNSVAANEFAVRCSGGARFVSDLVRFELTNAFCVRQYTSGPNFIGYSPRMIIDKYGNVGFGTETPSAPLHLKSTSASGPYIVGSTPEQLIVESTNDHGRVDTYRSQDVGVDWGIGEYKFSANVSSLLGGVWRSTKRDFGIIQGVSGPKTTANGSVKFLTLQNSTLTEAMRIAGGNVGIGAPTPSSRLHVTSDSTTSQETGVTVDIPGIGTRRIIVGDPNTAGAGYRTLRVAN